MVWLTIGATNSAVHSVRHIGTPLCIRSILESCANNASDMRTMFFFDDMIVISTCKYSADGTICYLLISLCWELRDTESTPRGLWFLTARFPTDCGRENGARQGILLTAWKSAGSRSLEQGSNHLFCSCVWVSFLHFIRVFVRVIFFMLLANA